MNDTDNLVREQLIAQLHNISFCAFLTALTSEECLEVEIMTSKGTCYSWIGYDDWKVYCVSPEESAKLSEVSKILTNEKISKDDFTGTCFFALADVDEPAVLKKLYIDFVEKGIIPGNEFYCYYNEIEEKYYFFSAQEELAAALNQYYADVDSLWEDMDTDKLSQWWDRYKEESGEIPFCYLGDAE